MNKKEFIESTARTWNNQDREKNIRHALLGMRSEVGEIESALKKVIGYGRELDRVNVLEEIGDLFYFSVRLWSEFSHSAGMLNLRPCPAGAVGFDDALAVEEFTLELGTRINSLSSYLYEKVRFEALSRATVPVFVSRRLEDIVDDAAKLLSFVGYTPEECFARNVDKLRKRFPEKFDQDLAQNRDLETERAALEGTIPAAARVLGTVEKMIENARGTSLLEEFGLLANIGPNGTSGRFTGVKIGGGFVGLIEAKHARPGEAAERMIRALDPPPYSVIP